MRCRERESHQDLVGKLYNGEAIRMRCRERESNQVPWPAVGELMALVGRSYDSAAIRKRMYRRDSLRKDSQAEGVDMSKYEYVGGGAGQCHTSWPGNVATADVIHCSSDVAQATGIAHERRFFKLAEDDRK